MVTLSNPALYAEALKALSAFKSEQGSKYRGRFVQIYLGLKFYQNEIPSMHSGQFVTSEVLQTILDDLYNKASRPSNDSVLMLFENSYLARTGIKGKRNTTVQNTWRNNFNLQKGIGCFAPPSDLSSNTFLDQSRIDCRHISLSVAGSLAGASCSLCPSGAKYRNESHRKWLRIDIGGNGYALPDMMNTENFVPYIAPNGNRIPSIPLLVALYHDTTPGLLLSNKTDIDIADFLSDFNFSANEYSVYFDDSSSNKYNKTILSKFPSLSYVGVSAGIASRTPRKKTVPGISISVPTQVRVARTPVLTGTQVTPPTVNSGWDAEVFVEKALAQSGWKVYNVSRQRLGYDLYAQKGHVTKYIEIKSSVNTCSPSLTLREWQQAKAHSNAYILAIIENFNPQGLNTIYWVPDPTNRCQARQCTVVQYSIARSSWVAQAIMLKNI
jgi:hypothetical protein